MNLTDEEVKTLESILKVEIFETKDLIQNADEADKTELDAHLERVKSIRSKIM